MPFTIYETMDPEVEGVIMSQAIPVPSKVTITDIISSGKLNLLKNEVLKNNLIRYYAELDKYLYQLEINNSSKLLTSYVLLKYQYRA